jgi:hypothetical protein
MYIPEASLTRVKAAVSVAHGATVTSFACSSTPLTFKVRVWEPSVPPVFVTSTSTVTDCPGEATIGVTAREVTSNSAEAVEAGGWLGVAGVVQPDKMRMQQIVVT